MRRATTRWKKIRAVVCGCVLLMGCASRAKYGEEGWTVQLRVVTVSPATPVSDTSSSSTAVLHYPAYLVPDEVYQADPSIAESSERLKPYARGVTPATVSIKNRNWWYVVGLPGGGFSKAQCFKPSDPAVADGNETMELIVDQH